MSNTVPGDGDRAVNKTKSHPPCNILVKKTDKQIDKSESKKYYEENKYSLLHKII